MVQLFHCDPGLLNPSYPVVVVVVVQFHLQDPPPPKTDLSHPPRYGAANDAEIFPMSFLKQPKRPQQTRRRCYGTTAIPIDFAWWMTALQSPSNGNPDRRSSDCLILAIS